VEFKQIERTDVSATLGKDSLKQAKTAALIGLLIVALFLLVFYRFLGVIAVIGLGIYAAFLYAAILLLNVTLTLPGFAGLILTIGVAADANVVIFERIKEEVRAGRTIRQAIAQGYQKGFHTIVDANVVTCITAFVLFAAATAQVKGSRRRGRCSACSPASAGSTTRASWARRGRRSRAGSGWT
jgi:SecD/SecF fusion protein